MVGIPGQQVEPRLQVANIMQKYYFQSTLLKLILVYTDIFLGSITINTPKLTGKSSILQAERYCEIMQF